MVPAVMVKVPVPKAEALLMSRVPAVKVVPPVKVLAPASVRVPAVTVTAPVVVPTMPLSTSVPTPALEMLSPAPLIAPPAVRVLPETVTVGLAPKVTAPVPRFKEEPPVKVKPAFQFITLLFDKVMAEAEVLSMVPPAMVKVLVPRAVALLMSMVPEFRVVVPLYVLLALLKIKVPLPLMVRLPPVPVMALLIVTLPALPRVKVSPLEVATAAVAMVKVCPAVVTFTWPTPLSMVSPRIKDAELPV